MSGSHLYRPVIIYFDVSLKIIQDHNKRCFNWKVLFYFCNASL